MCRFDTARSYRAILFWALPAILMILMAAPCAGAAEKGAAAKDTNQQSKQAVSPDAAIRASADAFVQAFERGDAKAVAALWTPDGTMADDRGQIFKGRKAIEDQYAAFFKACPGAKMVVAVKSIDFPTPSVAVEDGMAQVVGHQPGPPVASRYTVVHVCENGKWLMASVRETTVPLASNYSKLEDLGWLIGIWENRSGATIIRSTFRWIANKSFIQRDYSVRQDGIQTISGVQIIGWDPQAGQVRSWSFDASGGYGSSLWTATPDGWQSKSSGVTPDGVPTSSQEMLIRVPGEDNVLGWRSVDRSVGDVGLPDTAEVVLDRLPEKR